MGGDRSNYAVEKSSCSCYRYQGREEHIIYIAGIMFYGSNSSSYPVNFIKGGYKDAL